MDDNDDDNDNDDDYRVRPTSILPPGSACPAFPASLLALLEDGRTLKVFSRESLAADYVVLLFLPTDGSLDTTELAALREQVQWRRNMRGDSSGPVGRGAGEAAVPAGRSL